MEEDDEDEVEVVEIVIYRPVALDRFFGITRE